MLTSATFAWSYSLANPPRLHPTHPELQYANVNINQEERKKARKKAEYYLTKCVFHTQEANDTVGRVEFSIHSGTLCQTFLTLYNM